MVRQVWWIRSALALIAAISLSGDARAGSEFVHVTRAMDDKAIITRTNGDTYLIEKGVGCLSLWRYEGRSVLVVSPGMFLGVGSSLLIPELDQECRIWTAEFISGPQDLPPSPGPSLPSDEQPSEEDNVRAVQEGLIIVGFAPGAADGALGPETVDALREYASARGIDVVEDGAMALFLRLAVDVAAHASTEDRALAISLKLVAMTEQAPSSPPRPADGSGDCVDGHWVSSVLGSGEFVKLEDNSLWQIDPLDRIDTMLWLPTESIMVCARRLINTDTGDVVAATKIAP